MERKTYQCMKLFLSWHEMVKNTCCNIELILLWCVGAPDGSTDLFRYTKDLFAKKIKVLNCILCLYFIIHLYPGYTKCKDTQLHFFRNFQISVVFAIHHLKIILDMNKSTVMEIRNLNPQDIRSCVNCEELQDRTRFYRTDNKRMIFFLNNKKKLFNF